MLKKNKDEEINVDLWPSGMWTKRELNEFETVFEEFGDVSGQISDEARGLSLFQIGFIFVAPIAWKFFEAMAQKMGEKAGEDLYDYGKSKLSDLLLKNELKTYFETDDNFGYVYTTYKDPDRNSEFYYACNYRNEDHLNIFFSSLNKINSLIISAIDQNLYPFNECNQYSIHLDLDFIEKGFFELRISRCLEKEQSEIFDSEILIDTLEDIEWTHLDWEIVDFSLN